jgi:hypothetical protein
MRISKNFDSCVHIGKNDPDHHWKVKIKSGFLIDLDQPLNFYKKIWFDLDFFFDPDLSLKKFKKSGFQNFLNLFFKITPTTGCLLNYQN